MSRRWFLVALVAFLVMLVSPVRPGPEAKPSPPGPRMVAFTSMPTFGFFYAMDSNGDLYKTASNGSACDAFTSGQVLGNMFNGPPPSAVVDMGTFQTNDQVWVCLENGDVYVWCAATGRGVRSGNMFTLAGR
jgi:hypothetical protein